MTRLDTILVMTAVLVLSSGVIAADRESVTHRQQEQTVKRTQSLILDQSIEWALLADAPYLQRPRGDTRYTGLGKPFMKRRGRLERLRMKKMLEVLELRPKQKDDFLVFAKQHRKEIDILLTERSDLMMRLAEEIHSDPMDRSAISDLLDAVELLEKKQYEHRAGFIRQAKELLSLQQLARLVVFQEHFEARIFDKLRSMRKNEPRKQRRGTRDDSDGREFEKNKSDG